MYTMEPRAILAMPEGCGINFVLNNSFYGSDPEYLFFTRHKHNRDDWIEQSYSDLMYDYSLNVDYYYEVIYENSSYICYRKRDL